MNRIRAHIKTMNVKMDLWHLYLVKCGEREKKSDKNPLNFHLDDVKQAKKFTSILFNLLFVKRSHTHIFHFVQSKSMEIIT